MQIADLPTLNQTRPSHPLPLTAGRFGGAGGGSERIIALVTAILALPEPSAHRREGAQDDNKANTCCDVGGKHTSEDQQPGKHDDTGQNNKTVQRSVGYHRSFHQQGSVIATAHAEHFDRLCRGQRTYLSEPQSPTWKGGAVITLDLLAGA